MFYEKSVLDNGAVLLTERMPDVRSVTMGFWFKVGSRDEKEGQEGLSHFMEHMMFKGTPSRDAYAISSAFDALGAELNAFTAREYTCYYCRVVDERMRPAFEMLADMVSNSLFPQEQIELEREVVLEEIARGKDNPEDYVWDLHTSAMFPNSPIGRPIAGMEETVSSFQHDDCIAYRDSYYCAENLVIAIAGNIEHDQARSMAEEFVSGIPQGKATVRKPTLDEPAAGLACDTRQSEQAHMIYALKSYCLGHPDRYALSLLDSALGGGMSSRLFQEIREKRGLAYAVFSQTVTHTDAGELCIYAGTRPDNLGQVIELVRGQLSELCEHNISQDELKKARDCATGQIMLSLESTRSRMVRLGRPYITGQELHSVDETLERYRQVSLDDVGRVASDLFGKSASVAVVSPLEDIEVEKIV